MNRLLMKKFLVWVLIMISAVALLLRFSDKGAEIFLGVKQTSGISINSEPSDAVVFLNDQEVGKTPFEDKNLNVGEYNIKLKKDKAAWEGKAQLSAGTITVVNRDLASELTASAGEILTLQRGQGVTVISNPSGADVEIGGKVLGKTPLTVNIERGAQTIVVSHLNYQRRSLRANLPADYNLTASVTLALSEADLTNISTPTITQTPEVLVLQTPTGFLRVRDKPNLNSQEIAQVKPGESLVLLEEQGAWDRVRLSDGTEGFVSSSYVEKKDQAPR